MNESKITDEEFVEFAKTHCKPDEKLLRDIKLAKNQAGDCSNIEINTNTPLFKTFCEEQGISYLQDVKQ